MSVQSFVRIDLYSSIDVLSRPPRGAFAKPQLGVQAMPSLPSEYSLFTAFGTPTLIFPAFVRRAGTVQCLSNLVMQPQPTQGPKTSMKYRTHTQNLICRECINVPRARWMVKTFIKWKTTNDFRTEAYVQNAKSCSIERLVDKKAPPFLLG